MILLSPDPEDGPVGMLALPAIFAGFVTFFTPPTGGVATVEGFAPPVERRLRRGRADERRSLRISSRDWSNLPAMSIIVDEIYLSVVRWLRGKDVRFATGRRESSKPLADTRNPSTAKK